MGMNVSCMRLLKCVKRVVVHEMSSFIAQITRYCDLIIAACYLFIPTAILAFIRSARVTLLLAGGERGKRLAYHVAVSIVAFIYACGATHAWRFTLLFGTSHVVAAVLVVICACTSLHTVVLLACNMRSILQIVSSIEISNTGRVSELKHAYDIAEEYICDMLSVHRPEDYSFVHVNEACSAYGYDPEILAKSSLLDLMHPEDRPVIEAGFKNLKDTAIGKSFIYRMLTGRGAYVYVETTCKAGRWENKDASFLVTRNVQGRLDQFQRDTLVHGDAVRIETNRIHAATLAHDLRTSLSIFDLAAREIRSGGNTEYALDSAEGAVWFMKFILDRTIESCRVLQGHKPVPELEDIKVHVLLDRVVSKLHTYPRSVDITCDVAPEVESYTFVCDDDWLTSILTSFISNAFDNTMYGSVKVSVHNNDNRWMVFEIADTGVGIQGSDLNRLFCPFSKMSNKLKIEHGVGIGLYNCAWRIRLLGGTYGVRANVSGGCTFHFRLPLSNGSLLRKWRTASTALQPNRYSFSDKAAPIPSHMQITRRASEQSDTADPASLEASMASMRVLIVDDVSIYRTLLRKQLERRGIVYPDEAADGVEALEMMKTKRYDVVLMDVMMPRMNGDDCVRRLREWESECDIPHTPVILMSADVLTPENDLVASGDVQQFFSKPINIVRLGNALRDIAVGSKKRGSWLQTLNDATAPPLAGN
jgi:CheY-like chemotaxis protein